VKSEQKYTNPARSTKRGESYVSGSLRDSLGDEGSAAGLSNGLVGEPSQVIGNIQTVIGSGTVTRADGAAIQVKVGDPVCQGDVIETAADGRIGIHFIDDTAFNLSSNARMGGTVGKYKLILIAVDAAKKRSSARLKKRLSKKQTRAASTTGVAAKEEAGSLAVQPPMGWYTDDRTANQFAAQISDRDRKFIAAQQSPGMAPVAPSATSSRNVTIAANVAAEKMPL
jgi:hypothetical protein